MFSANKAAAGGITAAASDFVTYLLTTWVPGFTTLPPEQVQNLELIVSFVLVGLAVYFTPNRIPPEKVTA